MIGEFKCIVVFNFIVENKKLLLFDMEIIFLFGFIKVVVIV